MPSVRKQEYTRPIPEGATRTTLKIRRRGKDIEVPAVRFKGTDGRMISAPVVQTGKGSGTHYRAESENYYGLVKGKQVKLCTNKAASEAMLANLIGKAARGEANLLDPFEAHKKRPLGEHIDDYAAYLQAKGSLADTIERSAARVSKALVNGCNFAVLANVDAGKVARWLADQRKVGDQQQPIEGDSFTVAEVAAFLGVTTHAVRAGLKRMGLRGVGRGSKMVVAREAFLALLSRRARGMGEQTAHHYRVTLRAFGRWLAGPGKRCAVNPLAELNRLKVVEIRHARRELTADEIRRLLTASATSSRDFRRLDGPSRAVLYATACGTGFRAGGLASLTLECFNLDSTPPYVVLPTRGDKSKVGKVQPIPPDLAATLRNFLPGKPAGKPVWPGTWAADRLGAEMLRGDLEEAAIPYVTPGPNGPEHADFHSLRHSYLTALGRSGVDLRVQQELAGHSTPVLTARYSHVRLHDLAAAVDRLPSFSPTAPTTAAAPASAAGQDGQGLAAESAYVQLTFTPDHSGGFQSVPEEKTPNLPTDGEKCNPLMGKGLDGSRGQGMTVEESIPTRARTEIADLEDPCVLLYTTGTIGGHGCSPRGSRWPDVVARQPICYQ